MDAGLLGELERLVLARNPLVAKGLQPGLPEARVRRYLERGKVTGDIEILIALYTWRDGSTPVAVDDGKATVDRFTLARPVFFPGQPYYFLALEEAVEDFRSFKGSARGVLAGQAYRHVPYMSEAVGRYFPVFSTFSTGWLCVDVLRSSRNRVMIVDFDLDRILVAYDSFEEFMDDAIRASREGRGLTCFQAINRKLMESLGREIASRNPPLWERLQPGIPEAEVRSILAEAGIHGRIEALVVLYTWRNGELVDPEVPVGDTAFLRTLHQSYRFLNLREALDAFEAHKRAAEDFETLGAPEKKRRVRDIRAYFPVLSDDRDGYVAIDLAEARNGVAVIDFQSGAAREVYASFDGFLRDGIRHDFFCVIPVEDIQKFFV